MAEVTFSDAERPLDIRKLASIYIDIPAARPGTAGACALAVALASGALAMRLALDPYIEGAQYITFFPAVMIATLISGFGAGLLCAAISVAVALYFLTEPRFSFDIAHSGDMIALLLFIAMLAIEVTIGAGMRFAVERHRELSRSLEQRVEDRTSEVVQQSRELDEKNRQLRAANEEFMAMYERGGIFIGRLSPEGVILDANRACIEGFGFARADIISKPIWKGSWWGASPEVEDWIRERVVRARAGEPSRGETSYVNGNGEDRVIEIAMMPIKDDAGRVVSIFAVGLDTTERARHYQATFENAAVGIAHASAGLKWTRVNEALSLIIGYPARDLIARPVLDYVHPDYREAVLADIGRLLEGTADSYDRERRYLRRDGASVWIRASVSAVRKDDGSVDHFVGVLQDITRRKEVEEELRMSEERFRASVLHAPVPIILYDDREEILGASDSWYEKTGYSKGELRRLEDWTSRAYPDRAGDIIERIRREVISGEPAARRSESAVRTSDGQDRPWTFVTSALGKQPDGRRLFITVADDMTERKTYEEHIRLLMREMNHRAKNLLALVQVVARQTAASEPEDFMAHFSDRIQAIAANQDLLIRTRWHGVDTDDLVQTQLAHFSHLVGHRIRPDGPKLRLNGAAAQAVGLALHELATNAGKYGALSTGAGHVDIVWAIDGDRFTITWTEHGGPPVRPPSRQGFGTTVVDKMAKLAVGGDVRLDYNPAGLVWQLTCPAANALEGPAKQS
jgi:PAS domain S-box-containing protein